nr:hypothetical protein [Tanacetum cinerariifolium]
MAAATMQPSFLSPANPSHTTRSGRHHFLHLNRHQPPCTIIVTTHQHHQPPLSSIMASPSCHPHHQSPSLFSPSPRHTTPSTTNITVTPPPPVQTSNMETPKECVCLRRKLEGIKSGGQWDAIRSICCISFHTQIGDDDEKNPIDVDNVDYVVNLQSNEVKKRHLEQAYLHKRSKMDVADSPQWCKASLERNQRMVDREIDYVEHKHYESIKALVSRVNDERRKGRNEERNGFECEDMNPKVLSGVCRVYGGWGAFWVLGRYGQSRTVLGVFPVDEYYRDVVVLEMKKEAETKLGRNKMIGKKEAETRTCSNHEDDDFFGVVDGGGSGMDEDEDEDVEN